MTKNNWVLAGLLAVLAVLAGGWFLLVSPTRAEAAALREQASSQDDTNDRVRMQLQELQAQADSLPEQQRLLDEVAAKIPDSAQLPELLRALTAAAEESDVEFVSLVPGPPVPASPAAAPAATGTDAGAAAPAPASAARSGPALHVIPISINVVGGYHDVEHYLSRLEDLPRALRVTGLVLAPGANPVAAVPDSNVDDGRSLAALITGSVYLTDGDSAGRPGSAGPGVAPSAAFSSAAPTSDDES